MKKVSDPKVVLTIRIDKDVLEKLKEISNQKNKTLSCIANEAIKVFVYDAFIPPATKPATYTNTNTQSGDIVTTLTDEQIRKLNHYSKLNINNQTMTVLDFIKKCKKKTNINELKTLLKRSTLEELSKTLWR